MEQAYCVKCKKMVVISKGKEVKTKNGRKMIKGVCPNCGTTVCKFIKG